MSMFGRDLLGNVRMRIVHFDSIYAQKDSFAHRYGFSEICGCVPLDLGCFGPVARSRRAFYLRRAAGGCFGGHGKLTSGFGRWLRSDGCGLRGFGRWRWLRSAGCVLRALARCVCLFPRGRSFFSPLPRLEARALTPGGLCGR